MGAAGEGAAGGGGGADEVMQEGASDKAFWNGGDQSQLKDQLEDNIKGTGPFFFERLWTHALGTIALDLACSCT